MAKARRVRTRRGMLRRYVAGAPSAGRGAAPVTAAGGVVPPAPSAPSPTGQISQPLTSLAGGLLASMASWRSGGVDALRMRALERLASRPALDALLRGREWAIGVPLAQLGRMLGQAGVTSGFDLLPATSTTTIILPAGPMSYTQALGVAAIAGATASGSRAVTQLAYNLVQTLFSPPSAAVAAGLAAGLVGLGAVSARQAYYDAVRMGQAQVSAAGLATQYGGSYMSPALIAGQQAMARTQVDAQIAQSLAMLPGVNLLYDYAGLAASKQQALGIARGGATYAAKARTLAMLGIPVPAGVGRQSADYLLAVGGALAPWGQGVARGLAPSRAELSLDPGIWAAAASTIGSLGMQTWAGSVRHGLLSGASLASLAESAAPLLVAQGDLAGLATLRPLLGGRRHERLLRTAARGIDLRAAAELAGLQAGLATGEVTLGQAEGRALADLPTGGATQALWQAATQLGRVADWMAKQVGAEHPLTLAARGQELSALTQLAEWHTSLRLGRLDETLQRANVRLSGYGVAAAMLPLSAVPEAGLQLWGAQASIQQDQLAAIRRTAAAFPNGPIRWELEAQANDLEASMVAGYLSAQQGAQAMRGVWHQYGQALRLPGIARQTLFAPREGVLGRIAMTRADIGYLQQVAANQWLPAAQRLGAAAQAAELEASIPGLEASLTDIRIREIGHQYSMRSLQASILAAGAQFGASPLPGIRAQMSAVTGYLYQLGGLSNLTWDQSMQKEQAQASARAQLAGALPSILASGLARLDVGYGIAAIRQTGLEQRAAMLPFGSGGLGVMAQGVQIRSLRLSELQYRWQRLAQEGLLTPESALSIAREQESLMTANAAALASLTYGMEARLPALGINLNGIARFNATQLAGMFMPGPWGGTSAAVNAFGAMLTGAGGGQVANAIVAKLDELIATVREGMQATGVSVPRPSVYTWDQLGG